MTHDDLVVDGPGLLLSTSTEAMILDRLINANRYAQMHPGFAPAFAFLRRPDLAELPPERIPIDGDHLLALPQHGPGRRRDQAPLEAHRRYIDIQYVVSGHEEMGWRPTTTCARPRGAFDYAQDIQFFDDAPDTWFSLHSGAFAIFFPEDAHAPSVADAPVRKIVIKVAVERLA